MSWKYVQRTGELFSGEDLIATGYSGFASGKNNPAMQTVANVGPIPLGRYEISFEFSSETFGPVCMHLTPMPGTDTHGRGGFLVHGDSFEHPGAASHGCLILPRLVRMRIAASKDHELEVV